jgi:hypothetical protein
MARAAILHGQEASVHVQPDKENSASCQRCLTAAANMVARTWARYLPPTNHVRYVLDPRRDGLHHRFLPPMGKRSRVLFLAMGVAGLNSLPILRA